MNASTTTRKIKAQAQSLAEISVDTPVIDAEQLVRFSLIDEQVTKFGKVDLTGMSREQRLADLLDD